MYTDTSYDVPGEMLVVIEHTDLQSVCDGLMLARLICTMLDRSFLLCLDMSACHITASAAIKTCFEALLQIIPRFELERRLWFYQPPNISEFLPHAQITGRKPQSITLAHAKVGPIRLWNG